MDKQVIAAFDFDGTITTCDTLPLFIRHISSVKQLILGSLYMVPFLILFKLRLIPNHRAKRQLFKYFLNGMHIDKLNALAASFVPSVEAVLNPVAMERIKWHRQRNHEVIIISASAENWIKPWANAYGIDVILATQLKRDGQIVTGEYLTVNCYGQHKVERILEKYPQKQEYILYAYGDSKGDRELLEFADYAFYRRFE